MIEFENLHKTNKAFAESFQQVFQEVLQDGWYILGKRLEFFEQEFAAYCESRFCVGLSSGLNALKLALRSYDFPAGSEVLVSAHTFIATIIAILESDLKPILIEPDPQRYTMDPQKLDEAISPKAVAIIPVHMYGKMCPMPAIQKLATAHNLKVIEDASQAHGALYQGKKAGSWGDLAAFSFYPTKNLGALGDAGCVMGGDLEKEASLRMLRNYGSREKYYYEIVGGNERMDEVQAAFLSCKLKHLDAINAHKRKLAFLYHTHLKDEFGKPLWEEEAYDVFYIYPIRHPQRDRIREYLFQQGIQTGLHYPIAPVDQKAYKGLLSEQSTPITQSLHRELLSLPISYSHTESDIMRVIETLNAF